MRAPFGIPCALSPGSSPPPALRGNHLAAHTRARGQPTRRQVDAGPDRIELRMQMRQVTFDFTNAVITSRILRIDADMKSSASWPSGAHLAS